MNSKMIQPELVLENMPGLTLIVGLDGIMQYAGSSSKHLLGYNSGTLLYRSLFDLLHEEDLDKALSAIQGAAEKNWQKREILRLKCSNGEYRWFEFVGNRFSNTEKEVSGAIFNIRDITGSAHFEKKSSRHTGQSFLTLIHNMAGMLYRCSVDKKWTIENVNEGCYELTGYQPSDLERNQTLSYGDLIHPEDRNYVWEQTRPALERQKPFQLEYRIKTATGGEKWILDQRRGVLSESGKINTVEGFATDITKYRQSLEALRQSEERFQILMDSIAEAYYEVDLKGVLYLCNNIYLEMTGFSREDIGTQYTSVAKNPEEVFKLYNKVYRTGIPKKNVKWVFVRKDDSEIIVEKSISLIRDKNGKPAGFRGLARDITERIKIEEALRQSEEKYREIISSIEEAYVETDLRGYYTFFNHAFPRLTGYSQEALNGKDYKLLAKNKEDEKKLFEIYNKVYQTGIPDKGVTWTLTRKDGSEIFVELSVSLIKDKAGQPVGFRGIGRDITERRRDEMKIELQKKHFEALFINSTDAIVFLNRDARVMSINEQFSKLFGYLLKDIQNKNLDHLTVPAAKAMAAKLFSAKIFKGEAVEQESIRQDRNGKAIDVAIKGIPVVLEDDVVGAYCIYSDITERKKYENQLKFTSMHDALTGAYNRAYFEEEINRLQDGREHPISIIVADVNDMKFINDNLGHDAGDILLKTCSTIFNQSVRHKDVIARIGGDEFVVILPKTPQNVAIEISRRINRSMAEHKKTNPEIPLSVSLGIATTTKPGHSLHEVFKEADNDMYSDKLAGGVNIRGDIVNTLLNTLAERDFITGGHAERMSRKAKDLGEQLGLIPKQLNELILLSHVHDLGKVGIPDNILFKPGKLNEEEWEEMRRHPEIGQRIASSSSDLQHISELILHHHEKWDGTGYPKGLKGEEIPIECRILAIVDAFDAMTNVRPYRDALTEEEALNEIRRCSGTQFDPDLVDKFIKILGKNCTNESR